MIVSAMLSAVPSPNPEDQRKNLQTPGFCATPDTDTRPAKAVRVTAHATDLASAAMPNVSTELTAAPSVKISPAVNEEPEAEVEKRRGFSKCLHNYIPGYERLARLPKQLLGISPFDGDYLPSRVPLISPFRMTLPVPTPFNFRRPIEILATYFKGAEKFSGAGRDNRYLDVPGFGPVLVTRDPAIIRAITTNTGEKEGQFDRDELPSMGIAQETGADSLLYSNGEEWKKMRKLAAAPFGKTALFSPERFQEFEATFRDSITKRLEVLRDKLAQSEQKTMTIKLEPEIKTVMLEMLVNNFFGANLPYDVLREKYVPALERVIDRIVRDTVLNKIGLAPRKWPAWTPKLKQAKEDRELFDELTKICLETRKEGKGLWREFKSDAPDVLLRANIKVFLAGALEATTSFASWGITHLARNQDAQDRVYQEVAPINVYSPENLEKCTYLNDVMSETLRLTPSLYFLPRKARQDTWVETSDGNKMMIPKGTHILLDVWHANRNEEHWGADVSGYPATEFAPERWAEMIARGRSSKEMLHFGFGHGPRVCPGKHLGQLETALVVGAFAKVFKFRAPKHYDVKAGVSTKPLDGTEIELELREEYREPPVLAA